MRGMAITGGALALALTGAGGALGQDCPQARADALAGLTIVYDDGDVVHFTLSDDNILTEVTEATGDEPAWVIRAVYGLYELEIHDLTEDGEIDLPTVERMDFAVPLSELPAPEPGLRWTGEMTVKYVDELPFPRTVWVAADQPGTVSYGGCTYDSLQVFVRHRDDDDDTVLGFDWLPALGIAVYRSFADFGGRPDISTPVAITLRQD